MDQKIVKFNYDRRFGVEIELCSFDKRNFKVDRLLKGEHPIGMHYVANIVSETSKSQVEVMGWQHNHNNRNWLLKPDSSCGIELCTPVMRGWQGIKSICEVVEALKNDEQVIVDERCGLHVHVDVSDFSDTELANLLTLWIKCEAVFLDSVPLNRKVNRYCQQIGLTNLFEHNQSYSNEAIINALGASKYYTLNTYHKCKGNRATIEFRIIEGFGCLDPYLIKNWLRLIIHLVECSKTKKINRAYEANNQWSSFLWLDPSDVFDFLHFFDNLSKGMQETRNWFLARLYKNSLELKEKGIWSSESRKIAHQQIKDMANKFNMDQIDLYNMLNPTELSEALYRNDYRL